jgi:hypothetical protein
MRPPFTPEERGPRPLVTHPLFYFFLKVKTGSDFDEKR